MKKLQEDLLATSIRMYSLYNTALSLCSVKRLNELIDALLPHCIVAMDVATACLIDRNGIMHEIGSNLKDSDKEYLRRQSWRFSDQCVHGQLPSSKPFLASTIWEENRCLGTLIVIDKEVSNFNKKDLTQMKNLATIVTTALGNVYEYEDLIQKAEVLEEDIKRKEELELERLRQELKDARNTQMSLLPRHSPHIAGFDIAGICLPAREVGGDFYDYVPLGDDILAIVLADVLGKGMKSAMYAVLSYGVLHAEAKFGILPSQILWILNEDLHSRIYERMNCAMGIATIELNKKFLRYSNAGIPYPIIKRGSNVTELVSNGTPLGAMRNFEYEDSVEMELQTGDVVFFISDGITECPSKDDSYKFYDETKRLFSVIRELDLDMTAQEMIHSILVDLRDFSGNQEQSDDITIVVVKVDDK